jgi:hypothetical protein
LKLGLVCAVIVLAVTGITVGPEAGAIPNVAQRVVPGVQLLGSGSSVVFSPKTLVVEQLSDGTCGDAFQFNVVNETRRSQVVKDGGTEVAKVMAEQKTDVCFLKSPGTYTLGLKSSPGAKLTLVVGG